MKDIAEIKKIVHTKYKKENNIANSRLAQFTKRLRIKYYLASDSEKPELLKKWYDYFRFCFYGEAEEVKKWNIYTSIYYHWYLFEKFKLEYNFTEPLLNN